MNNDTDHQLSDQELSRAYKAMANESAPDALNERVLQMAAADNAKTTTANQFFALWSKPLAWAATIGLSLVIVLEVSQPLVPTVTPSQGLNESTASPVEPADDASAAAADKAERSVREEFAPRSENTIEEANQLVALQAGPNLAEGDSDISIESLSDDSAITSGDLATAEPASEAPQPAANAAEAVASFIGATEVDAIASIDPESKDLAKSARARQDSTQTSRCNLAAQDSAQLWAVCIEELRKSGDKDAADRELELLQIKFPAYATE